MNCSVQKKVGYKIKIAARPLMYSPAAKMEWRPTHTVESQRGVDEREVYGKEMGNNHLRAKRVEKNEEG